MRDLERASLMRAKALRRRLTGAETILWSRLRPRASSAPRFRRQHPIGPFIADFACALHRLVIEVDGSAHWTETERAYDLRRERYLQSLGWHVVRIRNDDVYKRLDETLAAIFAALPPRRERKP
jgi:very-short-patch-repair endonuclease